MKRSAVFLFTALLLAAMLTASAWAIDPFDPDEPLSLGVSFLLNDKPVSDVHFSLVRTADMAKYGEFTLTQAFRGSGAGKLTDLSQDEAQRLCETFYSWLEQHREIVPDDTGLTNANGEVSFPNQSAKLLPGLYLIVSERFSADGVSHEAVPFLVSLPYRGEDDVWQYHMSVPTKATDTQIDVQKVWQDSGYERFRPAAITVTLLKGTEKTVYDTAVLRAENGWHHTWKDLPGGYSWSVSEDLQGAPYKASFERIPGGFRIINTYSPPPGNTLPQTGLLWWPIPVLAGTGVLLFVIGWVKVRKCER